jgi:predicted dehydrogenase
MEVGDVQHLTTWTLRTCFFDPANPYVHPQPQLITFPDTSTERAELEHFADAVQAKRPLAIIDGEEQHNVTVLEAILQSAASGATVKIAQG